MLMVMIGASVVFAYSNKSQLEDTIMSDTLRALDRYNGDNSSVADAEVDMIQKTVCLFHCLFTI